MTFSDSIPELTPELTPELIRLTNLEMIAIIGL